MSLGEWRNLSVDLAQDERRWLPSGTRISFK